MIRNSNSSGIGAEIKLVLDVYIHSKIIMAFDTSDQAVFWTCTLSEYKRTTTTQQHNPLTVTRDKNGSIHLQHKLWDGFLMIFYLFIKPKTQSSCLWFPCRNKNMNVLAAIVSRTHSLMQTESKDLWFWSSHGTDQCLTGQMDCPYVRSLCKER